MNAPQLINQRMEDDSRHFLLLPEAASSRRVLLHILFLRGAWPTAYLAGVGECWIDFRYRKNKFSINSQLGDYWFFVADPTCPETILEKIAAHFSGILAE